MQKMPFGPPELETVPLPKDENAPLFDIYLRGRMHSGSMLMHCHFYHQLLLITRGSARFCIEGKQYFATPGSFLAISAFERHALEVTQYPYDGYVLAVNNSFIYERLSQPFLLSAFLRRPDQVHHLVDLDSAALARCKGLCQHMVAEHRAKGPLWEEVTASLIIQMMAEVYRADPTAYWTPQTARASALIDRAQQYIARHYREDLSLDDVARALYVSRCHLSHLFRQVTGYSYRDYLMQYRLSAAKEQLINSDFPVAQVAANAGWENANQFSRIFRQNEGLSPTAYRLHWRAQAAACAEGE